MSDLSVAKDHMTAYGRDWKLHMKRETTEEAPCRQTCPAGIDVPRYIRLISDGRFDDALSYKGSDGKDYPMMDYFGTKAITKEDTESALDDFYDESGLDKNGIPSMERLKELGQEWVQLSRSE